MWKLIIAVLSLAGFTAGASVQCSEEFLLQYGSVFAIPGACNQFLACTDGNLGTFTCPRGALFDVDLNRCTNDPQAKCLPEPDWTVADGLCGDLGVTSTLSDPHSCSRYALCLGEFTIPRQCDRGLLFNSLTGLCDAAQNVVCDVTCPSEGDEVVYLPDTTGENCARYFICKDGVPQPAECSRMQYFDLVTESCTPPAVASCRVPGVDCPARDELLANPNSCSSYYKCESGFPHFVECEAGQYFSNGQCIFGECDDLATDKTEGTTEGSSTFTAGSSTPTNEPSTVTSVTEGTTEGSSTFTAGSSTSTNEPSTVTSVTSTPPAGTESTIPTQTDSPPTVTTGLPSTTSAVTTASTEVPTVTTPIPTTSAVTTASTEAVTVTSAIPTTSAVTTASTEVPTVTTPLTTQSTGQPSTVSVATSTVDSTTSAVTDEAPSLDPADVCRSVDIGVFAFPLNCYQYYVCIFSSGRLFTCPNGQIFDPVLVCVAGSRESCMPTRPSM